MARLISFFNIKLIGRIIRIAGEVSLVDHNLETTAERLSVLAQCGAPVLKILANYKQKVLLAITDENILIKYKFSDEYCRVITELLTVAFVVLLLVDSF